MTYTNEKKQPDTKSEYPNCTESTGYCKWSFCTYKANAAFILMSSIIKEVSNVSGKKIIILESSDLETIHSIEDFNVKLLFQKKNGYGSALKEGIKEATTKFLCIIKKLYCKNLFIY